MSRLIGLVVAFGIVLACGPPPFIVHVTFGSEVDVVDGSAVVYEGVTIGEVTNVALRQDDPGQRARVGVTLAIEDPGVVLREHDRFRVAELRGLPVIEIAPAADASSPLLAGAVVVGESPLVTKFQETLGAAIESIGGIAAEAIEDALEGMVPPDPDDPDVKFELEFETEVEPRPAEPAQPGS